MSNKGKRSKENIIKKRDVKKYLADIQYLIIFLDVEYLAVYDF